MFGERGSGRFCYLTEGLAFGLERHWNAAETAGGKVGPGPRGTS